MKTIKLLTLIVVSIIGSVNITSCQNNANTQTQGGKVAVNAFEEKLKNAKDAQLVDVRTPEEYAEGHLQNAANIDIKGAEFEAKIQKLDKTKPVFVYCRSGKRSGHAFDKMKTMGFKEIYDLDGGIMEWKNANKPLGK